MVHYLLAIIMLDLDSRTSKLEREQRLRLNKLKKQQLLEQKKQHQYLQRQQELHELAQRLREEKDAAREKLEVEEALWLQRSGGVMFHKVFINFHVIGGSKTSHVEISEEEEAEADNDKITLPENCLQELMAQDVLSRFPVMLFRLEAVLTKTTTTSSVASETTTKLVTHAGVKEFSSPAESIGLPRKVLASLGGDLAALTSIDVRFVLLPKCTYAKLRPHQNRFFDVGPVKRCLEENLRLHATLTVGDVLTVWYRGDAHKLTVVELRPESEVTVLDTDVEIDLDLSQESHVRESEKQLKQTQPYLAEMPTVSSFLAPTVGQKLRQPTTISSIQPSSEMEVTFYSHHLLPNNDDFDESAPPLIAKFKLPTGKTAVGSFRRSQPLLHMFLFVSKELGFDSSSSAGEQQRLVLSTRFPARNFPISNVNSLSQSLVDCGFSNSSEQFFVTLN
jgi:hypothetical protein